MSNSAKNEGTPSPNINKHSVKVAKAKQQGFPLAGVVNGCGKCQVGVILHHFDDFGHLGAKKYGKMCRKENLCTYNMPLYHSQSPIGMALTFDASLLGLQVNHGLMYYREWNVKAVPFYMENAL